MKTTTEKLQEILSSLEALTVEDLRGETTLNLIDNGQLLAKIKSRVLKLYTAISKGKI